MCWYIIDAEEGAEITYGHKAKTKEELASLIEAGDWDGSLVKNSVKKGDFFSMYQAVPCMLLVQVSLSQRPTPSDTIVYMIFDRRDDQGQT